MRFAITSDYNLIIGTDGCIFQTKDNEKCHRLMVTSFINKLDSDLTQLKKIRYF